MYGDFAYNDYQINGVLISMGCWGNSKDIAMLLLSKYGGYIDENDCDDKGFELINIDLFEKVKEITSKDIFINKIISQVGFDKLKVILNLFDEYIFLTDK
jgi:hypothetical protein